MARAFRSCVQESLEPPGVAHHEVEVSVLLDGRAHRGVVVEEFVLGDLQHAAVGILIWHNCSK